MPLTSAPTATNSRAKAVRRRSPKSWDAVTKTLSLFLPALYPIQVGDAFTIRPGCDKTFATCQAKFDNAINFRGFPHVPGNDQVLSYPDAQS